MAKKVLCVARDGEPGFDWYLDSGDYYYVPRPLVMRIATAIFVTWSAAMFWFGWALHT